MAKLEQVLPAPLRSQLATLQESTATIEWERRGPRTDPVTLAALAAACRDRESITSAYTTRTGQNADRRVDPHHPIASGGLCTSWRTTSTVTTGASTAATASPP
ncbi:hypothetical protein AB0D97_28765 [Streptomyces roseus]|uniref:hypothetical protein n=1 Tax=Streptomyces roseus TaxID=66430 RepID=UPI0033E3107D